MEKLLLTKNGKILKRGQAVQGNPLALLSGLVELEPGFTLASFFRMIAAHKAFLQLSDVLETLLSMAVAVESGSPRIEDIEGLVFYKTIAMKGFPGKPGVEIYNSLKGVRGDEILGLKFFQMDSLLEHELHLGALKHVIFGDGQDMFSYDTFYSLYELIDGVSWEMSFNFNPLQCSIRG